MSHRLLRTSLAAATLLGSSWVASGQAHAAVVVDYTNFTGACGTTLTCVGNAAETSTGLQLTPASANKAGAGYSTTGITLGANSSFSTVFQFQISNAGGISPADGFAFVLAANATGLGGIGQGMGYEGVNNSVAVEFDTYFNNGIDSSGNHVAVDVNGQLTNAAAASPSGKTTCTFANASHFSANGCLANGNVWTANISYDGVLLNVFLQEAGQLQQHLISNYAIDIASLLGSTTAFVGFTAATGSGYESHNILNWSFANDTSLSSAVPEPASLALAGLALLGVGFARRRRSR